MSEHLYLRCPICDKLGKLEVQRLPQDRDYGWSIHCWSCSDGSPLSPDGWLQRLAIKLGCRKGDLLGDPLRYVQHLERGHEANGGAPVRPPGLAQGRLTVASRAKLHRQLLQARRPWLWLNERGIDAHTIRLAELGYDQVHDALVVPYPKGFFKTRKPQASLPTLAMAGKGLSWPLYVVSEERLRRCGWTLLCEGEWDTLRAESARLPAAGLPLGVSTWRECWAQQLVDSGVRSVVVCLDVGAEHHAERNASALRRQNLIDHAKVLDLRELGLSRKNSDLSDYLNGHGGTRTALLDHIKQRSRR
jgi:hypothetical protein